MKIGIVCYPTYGGSGVVATELGKALADKGHQVHFITYKQPFRLDSFHENIFYHEVNFRQLSAVRLSPHETALASKIVDIAEYEQLELLHVHYAIPHASAAYLAKQIPERKRVPSALHYHPARNRYHPWWAKMRPSFRWSPFPSIRVMASLPFLKSQKDTTYEHFDIRKDIEVIPNFIDFSRFKKLDKDHFRKVIASNGEKIIMHLQLPKGEKSR